MATPNSSPSRDKSGKVQELVGEFLQEKKRETREMAVQRPPGTGRRILTVVSAIACAAVWIVPSFVRTRQYHPTPERIDASTRMHIFLAAQRVSAYQRTKGRLPGDLIEAGVDTSGLLYARLSDTLFEISSSVAGRQLAFTSGTSPAEFLGNTFSVLGSDQ